MKWLLMAYVIILPMFRIPNLNLRSTQELAFQVCSLILIIASMFFDNRPIKKNKVNLWLGILFFTFLFQWVRLSCMGYGWSIVVNFFIGLMVYLSLVRTLKVSDIVFITKVWAGIILFAMIYLASQYLGFDPQGIVIKDFGGVPKCAFFGFKAPMGMYISSLMPMILAWSPLAFLGAIPVVMSYSTSAVLACVFGNMFFLWFRKRIVFWVLIPIMLAGGFFYLVKMDNPQGLQTSRFPMWGMVLQDAFKYPLGYGLDSFRLPYREGQVRYYKHWDSDTTVKAFLKNAQTGEMFIPGEMPERFEERAKAGKNVLDWWDHPHNEIPLWIFWEVGIIGLIAVIGLFIVSWLRFWRSRKNVLIVASFASIIAFLITGLTQFPLHLARVAHLLPILGAFFMVLTEE